MDKRKVMSEITIQELLAEHKEAQSKGEVSMLDFYVSLGVFSWDEIDDLDKRYSAKGLSSPEPNNP